MPADTIARTMPGDVIERFAGSVLAGDGFGGAGLHDVRLGRFAVFARQGHGAVPGGRGEGRLLAVIRMGE